MTSCSQSTPPPQSVPFFGRGIFIGYHSLQRHPHWLPLIAQIQLKVLTLIYHSHIGQAPRYLRNLICLPSSAISLRPLRSLDHHDLFVPRARTSMAQTRAFAIIGPSLWNQLLPSTRSTLLTDEPSASFHSLKTALFSLGLSHWKRF